jgi:hypothetical protein
MTDQAAPVPVPVHVVSVARAELEFGGAAAAAASSASSAKVRTVYRTVTLTAQDPAQELWAASDARLEASIMAIDVDVILADNKSDAAAGRGAYVPCVVPAATKPSLQSPLPIRDRRAAYVAPVVALVSPAVARVTVLAVYRD